ncbi:MULTISPECIES: hypothetical protein [unclassified Coleofasciculus]|jgi:hypothetical protein|nr:MULTISPECIES: hypothetical protein [unclassified Coleofasciculus]
MANNKFKPSPDLGKPARRDGSAPKVTGNPKSTPPKRKNTGK